MGQLTPPVLLGPFHLLDEFDSGLPVLDNWLKRRALKNQDAGASRTYVTTDGERVVAFYALAVGAIEQMAATGKVRRNMPEPVPVMILARLAVDLSLQGQGIGRALIRDALVRTEQAAEIAGIRAMLVHAINEEARQFYLSIGFTSSPVEAMKLMVTIQDLRTALSS